MVTAGLATGSSTVKTHVVGFLNPKIGHFLVVHLVLRGNKNESKP